MCMLYFPRIFWLLNSSSKTDLWNNLTCYPMKNTESFLPQGSMKWEKDNTWQNKELDNKSYRVAFISSCRVVLCVWGCEEQLKIERRWQSIYSTLYKKNILFAISTSSTGTKKPQLPCYITKYIPTKILVLKSEWNFEWFSD